jgi:hypothetical protein
MQRSKGFSAFKSTGSEFHSLLLLLIFLQRATEANIVGEVSAVIFSLVGGFLSQYFGRRLTMIFFFV